METIGKPTPKPARSSAAAAASIIIHAAVMAALLYNGLHWIAPIRYPGTSRGHNIVLTYLPGRAPQQSLTPTAKTPPENAKSQLALPQPEKKQPAEQATSPNTKSPVSDHPDSSSGADALGSGNINIALPKHYPTPRPDLAVLPRGTKGDVIVDVVIDEAGKISDMKLVQGIEHSIDEKVMATIREWTFNPANRDGQPVASEQELRFHYEKA
jgi:protein TonB